jgi:hypothetical protein
MACVLLPLTQLSDVVQIHGCVASGSSSYAAAFRLLKTQIESDVTMLRQEGVGVIHRPCVFFMSGGMPNDENWRAELDALADPSFAFSPNIVSFGVAGAVQAVIADVARWKSSGAGGGKKFFFMAGDVGSPGPAIKEMIRFLIPSGPIQSGPSASFLIPSGPIQSRPFAGRHLRTWLRKPCSDVNSIDEI